MWFNLPWFSRFLVFLLLLCNPKWIWELTVLPASGSCCQDPLPAALFPSEEPTAPHESCESTLTPQE